MKNTPQLEFSIKRNNRRSINIFFDIFFSFFNVTWYTYLIWIRKSVKTVKTKSELAFVVQQTNLILRVYNKIVYVSIDEVWMDTSQKSGCLAENDTKSKYLKK